MAGNGFPWWSKIAIIGGIIYLVWRYLSKPTPTTGLKGTNAYRKGMIDDCYVRLSSKGLELVDWRKPQSARVYKKIVLQQLVDKGKDCEIHLLITGGANVGVVNATLEALRKENIGVVVHRKVT